MSDHPDILISQLNLGNCYKAMRRLEWCASLLESCHAARLRRFGARNPVTVTALSALADLRKVRERTWGDGGELGLLGTETKWNEVHVASVSIFSRSFPPSLFPAVHTYTHTLRY
jgi:hypothetical protein